MECRHQQIHILEWQVKIPAYGEARDRAIININALPYTIIAFQELVHPASITKVKYDRHHDIIQGLGCGMRNL